MAKIKLSQFFHQFATFKVLQEDGTEAEFQIAFKFKRMKLEEILALGEYTSSEPKAINLFNFDQTLDEKLKNDVNWLRQFIEDFGTINGVKDEVYIDDKKIEFGDNGEGLKELCNALPSFPQQLYLQYVGFNYAGGGRAGN